MEDARGPTVTRPPLSVVNNGSTSRFGVWPKAIKIMRSMPSEARRRGSGGTSVPSVDRRAIVRKVVRKRSCLILRRRSRDGSWRDCEVRT